MLWYLSGGDYISLTAARALFQRLMFGLCGKSISCCSRMTLYSLIPLSFVSQSSVQLAHIQAEPMVWSLNSTSIVTPPPPPPPPKTDAYVGISFSPWEVPGEWESPNTKGKPHCSGSWHLRTKFIVWWDNNYHTKWQQRRTTKEALDTCSHSQRPMSSVPG